MNEELEKQLEKIRCNHMCEVKDFSYWKEEDIKAFIREHFISRADVEKEIKKRMHGVDSDAVKRLYQKRWRLGFKAALDELLALIKKHD